MRVGLYCGRITPLEGLAASFLNAGHTVFRRNPQFYGPDQKEPFDLVIAEGNSDKTRLLGKHCEQAGVPFWVSDVGYLRRADGYRRMAKGDFNWLPVTDETDRLNRLDVNIREPKFSPDKNKFVLVLGAGMRNQNGQPKSDWAKTAGTDFAAKHGLMVKYRPHPYEAVVATSLAEDLESAAVAVVYDSNAGNDALLAGVPVICHESAQYACVSLNPDTLEGPDVFALTSYFARVAYAQWTPEEMAGPEFLEFILASSFGEDRPAPSKKKIAAPAPPPAPEPAPEPESEPETKGVAGDLASERRSLFTRVLEDPMPVLNIKPVKSQPVTGGEETVSVDVFDVDAVDEPEPAPEPATEEKPKRRRGRPRKKKTDSE